MNIEKRRAEIAARKAEIRAFLEADDGKADMDGPRKAAGGRAYAQLRRERGLPGR